MNILARFERNDKLVPYGIFLLRITLGVLWIVHWWYKVGYKGMDVTEKFFGTLGYPPWLAWVDVSVEMVAFVLLVAGIYVRTVSLALLPIIILATLPWISKGYWFPSGGFEFPLVWCILQVVMALLGPGAFAWSSRHKAAS